MTENIFLASPQVRVWIESSHFRYPPARKDLTEPLAGFGHLQVFPTLWKMFQEVSRPSPDDLLRGLMGEAEPAAIQEKGLTPIENRAKKLVLDFGREVHAMALLNEAFGQVLYKGASDLGPGIDFIIYPVPKVEVGIHASMKAHWSKIDWGRIHQDRRARRGEVGSVIPLVYMTNHKVVPDRSSNGVWLYTRKNVVEIYDQLEAIGIHCPRTLL